MIVGLALGRKLQVLVGPRERAPISSALTCSEVEEGSSNFAGKGLLYSDCRTQYFRQAFLLGTIAASCVDLPPRLPRSDPTTYPGVPGPLFPASGSLSSILQYLLRVLHIHLVRHLSRRSLPSLCISSIAAARSVPSQPQIRVGFTAAYMRRVAQATTASESSRCTTATAHSITSARNGGSITQRLLCAH